MKKFITDYINNCPECQKYKASNQKPSGLLKTPIMSQRAEVLAIDLFGPLVESTSEHRWILIVTDTTTKWVELFPLQQATAEACAKTLINEYFLRYGVPRRIISDNGVQFVSAIMQYVAACFRIHQNLTPLYHPESNPVERRNRDLKTQLAILVRNNHQSWSEYLPSVRFAMNSTRNEITGYTPAFLTMVRELRTISDVQHDFRTIVQEENFVPQITPFLFKIGSVMEYVRENHENAQDKWKFYADKRRNINTSFEVGDIVLVKTQTLSDASKSVTSKFTPRRDGPYRVKACKTPTSLEVESLDGIPVGCYHASHLTHYKGDQSIQPIQRIRQRGRPKQPPHPEPPSITNIVPNNVEKRFLHEEMGNYKKNNGSVDSATSDDKILQTKDVNKPKTMVSTRSNRIVRKPTRYLNET